MEAASDGTGRRIGPPVHGRTGGSAMSWRHGCYGRRIKESGCRFLFGVRIELELEMLAIQARLGVVSHRVSKWRDMRMMRVQRRNKKVGCEGWMVRETLTTFAISMQQYTVMPLPHAGGGSKSCARCGCTETEWRLRSYRKIMTIEPQKKGLLLFRFLNCLRNLTGETGGTAKNGCFYS